MRKLLIIVTILCLMVVATVAGVVLADGASVGYDVAECGETNFAATNNTNISNMYLVVEAQGVVQSENIPAANSGAANISVGPFFDDVTIYWRVFGGGERNYDDPLWNGYGTATFGSDIGAYANSVGSYSWVIAGTSDPNPFTTWNSFVVEGCPITKDQCKDNGWSALGYANQGQCIKDVNTGE